MRILIIDDDDDIRRIAILSLSRIGKMEVLEAASGADGIRLAAETVPDCILLDMMMPGMDGTSTFAELQSSEKTSKIPVIFLTAKAMPSEQQRLKELGAAGVLTKPFDPMGLAGQIRDILRPGEPKSR